MVEKLNLETDCGVGYAILVLVWTKQAYHGLLDNKSLDFFP